MITLPMGYFPKKETEKNQERLTKTLTKIFGKISENLMTHVDNPYDVEDWYICNDRRSQKKVLSILRAAQALPYSNKVIKSYRDGAYHDYEKLFNEHSKDYETPLAFPDVPCEISSFISRDAIRDGFDTSDRNLKEVGYRKFKELLPGERIYTYHHIDLYDILITKERNYYSTDMVTLMIYPKVMLESRLKAVIKAVMKKYCEEDMLTYLNLKFNVDLKGQSQQLDSGNVMFKHKLRNTTRYPVTFSEHCYESAFNSYTKEYKKVVDEINFEYNRIKEFKDKIIAAGGTSAVLNNYIKTSVDNLIGKSLTLINGEDEDKNALEFILDHRDIITYDYLYNS